MAGGMNHAHHRSISDFISCSTFLMSFNTVPSQNWKGLGVIS